MTTYYTYSENWITLPASLFPVPLCLLTSDGAALTGLYIVDREHGPEVGPDWERNDDAAPFAEAKRQLVDYFAGKLTVFDLPIALEGTEFQRCVWTELTRIPYGETISYGEQARRIGHPGSARAVGLANGRNPISIVVPCHRVIGANGKLVGYGSGLPRKQALLSLEAATCGRGSHPLISELSA